MFYRVISINNNTYLLMKYEFKHNGSTKLVLVGTTELEKTLLKEIFATEQVNVQCVINASNTGEIVIEKFFTSTSTLT